MFFSSPSADIQIIFFLLAVSLAIAIASYIFSKKIIVGVFVMSVLSNVVLYLNSGSRAFDMYNLKSVVIFTLDYWPLINIGLLFIVIINIIKSRYAK